MEQRKRSCKVEYDVLDRWFVENGITDFTRLSALSGLTVKTLQVLGAKRKWREQREAFLSQTFSESLRIFETTAHTIAVKLKKSVDHLDEQNPHQISTVLRNVMIAAMQTAELAKYHSLKLATFALQELRETIEQDTEYTQEQKDLLFGMMAKHIERKANEATDL